MPGKFESLNELLDETIELPILGKMYTIQSPSARDGLKVEKITNIAIQMAQGGKDVNTEVLNDQEERDLFELCLGATYKELVEDGVPWVWLRHAALTAMMWISTGMSAAEQYWASAGHPETKAPNRAARRATGSAVENSTQRRGSTSGTNRRQGTRRPRPDSQK